ncbi:MAG TPA: hypothetical protein VFQ68_16360 [Streptosporangiaceae bacterium]|nr:hypothetical protein [Streptosporangiaceae bacterium]
MEPIITQHEDRGGNGAQDRPPLPPLAPERRALVWAEADRIADALGLPPYGTARDGAR